MQQLIKVKDPSGPLPFWINASKIQAVFIYCDFHENCAYVQMKVGPKVYTMDKNFKTYPEALDFLTANFNVIGCPDAAG